MPKKLIVVFIFTLASSCGVLTSTIPQPKKEFRGVWVATVVNIDWPKNGLDTVEKQKKDFLKILDFYQNLNYNAVIVQVRAAGDAFYVSEYAPWSRFLTGTEGENLKWKEDPLTWMIDQAHTRGLEFHAWLNPYRATFDLNTDILSAEHDYHVNPDWMVKYGTKYYYNPGLPKVQEKLTFVIDELTSNYDIDGIHFDDYFYPYTIKDEVFNDSITYYNCSQPNQSLEDWRRSNVDSLIKKSYITIKEIKPWVSFGVSPFGVWKNKSTDFRGSDTQAGQTTYENLYADPLLWMEKSWLDYIAPQIYWSLELPVASHKTLVDWWAKNSANTQVYIGNGAYKVRNNSDQAWEKKKELPNQFKLARQTPEITGNIVFSAKSLIDNNSDVVSYLKKKYYKWPALTPEISGGQKQHLENIDIIGKVQSDDFVTLTLKNHEAIRYLLVYASGKKYNSELESRKLLAKIFVDADSNQVKIPKSVLKGTNFAVTFLDRYGLESHPTILHLKQISGHGRKR